MATNERRTELGLPISCDVSIEKYFEGDDEEWYWRMEWVDPETAQLHEAEYEADYYSRRDALDMFIDMAIPANRNWHDRLERRRAERGF